MIDKAICNVLAKIARIQFIKNVMKYRLSIFKYDFMFDCIDHSILVLSTMPGVIVFNLETTNNLTTHYEVYLASEGQQNYLDVFYLNEEYPVFGKPTLRIVK